MTIMKVGEASTVPAQMVLLVLFVTLTEQGNALIFYQKHCAQPFYQNKGIPGMIPRSLSFSLSPPNEEGGRKRERSWNHSWNA